MTLDFGGVTPISHAAITGRAIVQDHMTYEENPVQISQSSGSRPAVVRNASNVALETIMESQNSSQYSPSKILIKNDKFNGNNSCVKEQSEEAEHSSGIMPHAQSSGSDILKIQVPQDKNKQEDGRTGKSSRRKKSGSNNRLPANLVASIATNDTM